MKNFRGFGGGMGGGNMQQLMKQAQAMQQQMAKAQEEVENAEFEGAAGGEMVKVVIGGNKDLKSIKIAPEVCDPDDIEMLEDLIVAALSDAYAKAEEFKEEKTASEHYDALKRKQKHYENMRWVIARIIDCNFDDKTKFLTLTFKDNIDDISYTNYEFNKFIKRLNLLNS